MTTKISLLPTTQAVGWGSGTADLTLFRDAANTLALRNGVNAQTFNVYNTFTDASNGEWLSLNWTDTANTLTLKTKANGTGTVRSLGIFAGGGVLNLGTGGNTRIQIRDSDGAVLVTPSGGFLFSVDNTYDIGASGANRPRNLFLAGGLTTGSTTLHTTTVALTNGAAAQTATLTNAPAAGNPTKWVPINDNGTTRYIPAW